MDPYAPINGISLEQYAELSADITDFVNDPEQVVRIVESKGVQRADWEAAAAGWTARMQDMALMGQVAMKYMPLYQAALARKKGTISCSFEDYVAMSGAAAALGVERMWATYGLDQGTWTQIAGHWNQTIPTDLARYGTYGSLVEQESLRIKQGGGPRPVNIQRAAGQSGVAAPAAQPIAASPQAAAQRMENQMMAQAVNAQVAAHMAAAQAQAASAYGNASANMGALGRGVMGVMGYGAIASGIGPGMAVLVQWSDGKQYPAKVMQVGGGQVCVLFGDGRQMWVPENAVGKP
jgi:hypothetical protein